MSNFDDSKKIDTFNKNSNNNFTSSKSIHPQCFHGQCFIWSFYAYSPLSVLRN